MMLRASAGVASFSMAQSSCVYYNEDTGTWDTAGLATDSVYMSAVDEADDNNGRVDVNVTCLSFHLSDFTISADEAEAAFRPVSLVSIATSGNDQTLRLQVRQLANPEDPTLRFGCSRPVAAFSP